MGVAAACRRWLVDLLGMPCLACLALPCQGIAVPRHHVLHRVKSLGLVVIATVSAVCSTDPCI